MSASAAKQQQQRIRNESYRESLQAWFAANKARWRKVYPILSGTDQDAISLRVLEALGDPTFLEALRDAGVPLSYYVESRDGTQRRLFNLPVQLQASQKFRRKKFMEAFARQNAALGENGGRFQFSGGGVEQEAVVETNVAQLQYMRFLLENNVLDWVRKHKDAIFEVKRRIDRRRSSSSPTPPPPSRKRSRRDSEDTARGFNSVDVSELPDDVKLTT
jgi:hypothetical protein